MRSLLKMVGTSLLVLLMSGCDGNVDEKMLQNSNNAETLITTGNKIELLNGKFTFYLPSNFRNQNGNFENQTNGMHVYTNESGFSSVLVIFTDDIDIDSLDLMLDSIELQMQNRDNDLQVKIKSEIESNNKPTLHRLDVVSTIRNRPTYLATIIGRAQGQIFTLQISLPHSSSDLAETTVSSIISTLQIQ